MSDWDDIEPWDDEDEEGFSQASLEYEIDRGSEEFAERLATDPFFAARYEASLAAGEGIDLEARRDSVDSEECDVLPPLSWDERNDPDYAPEYRNVTPFDPEEWDIQAMIEARKQPGYGEEPIPF